MINISKLVKTIFDIVVLHHDLLDSIITNKSFFFKSKFWFALYYIFYIKYQLFIIFHLQTGH